jgi:preprotein translocase subunit SecB
MYTLTILWPYAREYASDQFRRAGNHELVLPILNPQVVTQHIIEHDLVEVDILQSMPHA